MNPHLTRRKNKKGGRNERRGKKEREKRDEEGK
jgi:hypothetical protein